MKNIINITADIKRKVYIDKPVVVQNDSGVVFVAKLQDDGVDMQLSDGVHTMSSKRLDGVTVQTVGERTGESEVTFNLGTSELAVAGLVKASIQIYDIDSRISTLRFDYVVQRDLSEDWEPSENDKTLIEVVLGEGPAVIEQAKELIDEMQELIDEGVEGIKGDKGDRGEQGERGADGHDGASAYEIAVAEGFDGTEQEWLASLVGQQGEKGEQGLRGEKGERGERGLQGEKGDPGTTEWDGIDDKPEEFPPAPHEHVIEDIEGLEQALEDKADSATFATHAQDGSVHVYFGTAINTGVYSATIEGLQDVYAYTHGTGYCIEFSEGSTDEVFLKINDELPQQVLNAQLQPLVGMVDGTMLNLRYSETLEAFIAVDESEVSGGLSINGEEIEVELLEDIEAGDPIEFISLPEFTEIDDPITSNDAVSDARFSNSGKYFVAGIDGKNDLIFMTHEKGVFTIKSVDIPLTSNSCYFSFSDDEKWLAVSCVTSPYLVVYEIVDDNLIQRWNDGGVLEAHSYSIFKPNSTDIFYASNNEPYIRAFRIVNQNVEELVLDLDPTTVATGFGRRPLAFTRVSNILVVSTNISQQFQAFLVDDIKLTRISPLTGLAGTILNLGFSFDDTVLYATTTASSNSFRRYAFRGVSGINQINPPFFRSSVLTSSAFYNMALSPNGGYLAYIRQDVLDMLYFGLMTREGWEWGILDEYTDQTSQISISLTTGISCGFSGDGEVMFGTWNTTNGAVRKFFKCKTGARKLNGEASISAMWTGVAAEDGQLGDTITAYKMQEVKYYG